MDLFDVLSLLGGLALFLFGMAVMSSALEKRAGNGLKNILGSMTSSPWKGFLLGLGVTAIIQSSSATTVMVVGFVNSGVMALEQAVGVIMGANLGTSVTSWLLSTTGIESQNFWVQLLKPSSFTPVLAMVGISLYMFSKNQRRKDTGAILLGFAVLMFGMETMSSSVSGLRENEGFIRLLTLFSNPFLGVLIGAAFTAVIQSSSASVGILQALTATGSIPYATAVPIIMGQNIGTCISAVISCVGAGKNAKRAAVIHLSFNVIATLILLPLWYLAESLFAWSIADQIATPLGIAVAHTVFKVIALAMLMPFSQKLVQLSRWIIKDSPGGDETSLLDERLLATPSVAIARCRTVTCNMASLSVSSLQKALTLLESYDSKLADEIREEEDKVDMYEDKLGSYLVKLSAQDMTESDSAVATELLHMIGDFERISDHAVNIMRSADEIHAKKLRFSGQARQELAILSSAIHEILDLTLESFSKDDLNSAVMVEPLEQVVDYLKDYVKKQHIARLQKGECTIEMGFILADLLTDIERVSDHCSNIAGCLLEMEHDDLDIHEYLRKVKGGSVKEFNDYYEYFRKKYAVAE